MAQSSRTDGALSKQAAASLTTEMKPESSWRSRHANRFAEVFRQSSSWRTAVRIP